MRRRNFFTACRVQEPGGNITSHLRCKAFTLVEVLIGLALAVIVLGVVLNSVSRQTLAVNRDRVRYQSMLRASLALEQKMEQDASQEKSVTVLGANPEEKDAIKVETMAKVVTADPRVEQVEVTVPNGPGLQVSLSAYRLRIRRAEKSKAK